MGLTPGPNMVYLVSRSISQGRNAGLISLGGVALGYVFYMLCAAFGVTAVVLAMPHAYHALRFAGAVYLLWLAWQAVRPGGSSPFQVRDLPVDSSCRLFLMGFLTNLLNPKIGVMYLSLLPQFIAPANGSVLEQALVLGTIQVVVNVVINALIAMSAASIAMFITRRPTFAIVQRWFMGAVLTGLAVRMAL